VVVTVSVSFEGVEAEWLRQRAEKRGVRNRCRADMRWADYIDEIDAGAA
jgi:hypothetical protein